MLYIRSTLAAVLCAMFVLLPAIDSDAAGKKDKSKGKSEVTDQNEKRARAADVGSVRHTGKAFRNKRIKVNFEPNVEIVEGKITGIDRTGIYMDGEHFNIAYGKIVSSSGSELEMKDLHFGLKARVRLSYGSVEKTTISGLIKRPRIKSREEAMKYRETISPKLPEDFPDRSLPKEALEYKIEPPADMREGR